MKEVIIDEKDTNFLRKFYPLDRIFASPSVNGPVNMYSLIVVRQILDEIREMKKLLASGLVEHIETKIIKRKKNG